jgi:hypothetical protein
VEALLFPPGRKASIRNVEAIVLNSKARLPSDTNPLIAEAVPTSITQVR